MIRYYAIALSLVLLGGCQALPEGGRAPFGTAASSPAADVPRLMAYYRTAAAMDSPALDRELKRYRGMLSDGRCDESRIRLALVMLRKSTPGETGLLAPCLVDDRAVDTEVRDFAFLVDARLDALRTADRRYDAALAEIQRLKTENRKLSQQVEGLKSIEKSLQERDRQRSGDSSS